MADKAVRIGDRPGLTGLGVDDLYDVADEVCHFGPWGKQLSVQSSMLEPDF